MVTEHREVGRAGATWERTCYQESEGRETVQISRAVAGARETMEKELGTGVREDA